VDGGVGVMMINYVSEYGFRTWMNRGGPEPKVGGVTFLNHGHKWVFVQQMEAFLAVYYKDPRIRSDRF
jgi:hypothetical protein